MKLCLMNLSTGNGQTARTGPPPAVPAAEVLEFCTDSTLTPVPLAPLVLAGIASFHGAIVPVIATTRLLNPAAAPPSSEPTPLDTPFLVLSGPDGALGLQVDSVDLVTLQDPGPADTVPDADPPESTNFDSDEEKSSPDDQKSAQFTPQSAQEALFSEETQVLSYKVLEEHTGTSGQTAPEPGDTNQTAPGEQGIFSRALDIQERGIYRQIETRALSRYLKELLGTVQHPG
jgi:hypothetical protein